MKSEIVSKPSININIQLSSSVQNVNITLPLNWIIYAFTTLYHFIIDIDQSEKVKGILKELKAFKKHLCPRCGGAKKITRWKKELTCPKCEGTGLRS